MKKFFSSILISIYVATSLAGCGGSKTAPKDNENRNTAAKPQADTIPVDKLLAPPSAKDLYADSNLLKMTAGKAQVKHADGKTEDVTSELAVAPGDTITIAKGGAGTLVWFDDSISRLKEGTVMTIDKADYNPEKITQTRINFHVVKGEIWNKVRGLVDKDSQFLSFTGNVVSGVRGSAYNLVVDGPSVTMESVAHSAFLAPVDPKTNAWGKETRIVRGQLAKTSGKSGIQLAPILPKRLKDEWFTGNGTEDKTAAQKLREKNLNRLVASVGALPGEAGYGEKTKQLQNALDKIADPAAKLEFQARLAQLKAKEAVALSLNNSDAASGKMIQSNFDALASAVDAKGLSETAKLKLRAEAETQILALDRTLDEVLPDSQNIYDLKTAVRTAEVTLAPDDKALQAAKERVLERTYFDLNDASQNSGAALPESLQSELSKTQQELQKQSDFWKRNVSYEQDYQKMLQNAQDKSTDPTILKVESYFVGSEAPKKPTPAPKPVVTPPKVQNPPVTDTPTALPKADPGIVKEEAPYYKGPSGM